MQITPGYNFEPNEVPTKAKLQLMTTGMQVRGIDISQIDANLIGAKYTGDTQCSLPGEGWIMRSPQGMLWVKNRWGRVPFFRACWGGMETNRFKMLGSTTLVGGNPSRPNSFFYSDFATSIAATSESCTVMQFNTPSGTSTYAIKKTLETAFSNTYTRFLLWGGCVTSAELNVSAGWKGWRLAMATAAGVPSNDADGGQIIPYSAVSQVSHGIIVSIDTCVTSQYKRSLLWQYGNAMDCR